MNVPARDAKALRGALFIGFRRKIHEKNGRLIFSNEGCSFADLYGAHIRIPTRTVNMHGTSSWEDIIAIRAKVEAIPGAMRRMGWGVPGELMER